MATPFDVDLVKSGIDSVRKIQADRGKIKTGRLAPTINHREGYYAIQRISGFPDIRAYDRGESFETASKQKLEVQHVYPYLFGMKWETYLYDKDEDVYNEMADNISDAGLAMIRREDKEEMNLLNNGFDSNYTGADGVCLFSTAHTGVVGVTSQANRPAAGSTLDVTALEELLTGLMGEEDFNGESNYFDGDANVWCGVTLWPSLWRIVEAEFQAGGADNDPNWVGTRVRAMMSHQISSASGFYAVAGDTDLHSLRMIEFTPEQVEIRNQGNALETSYFLFKRFRALWESHHGTYANPGP